MCHFRSALSGKADQSLYLSTVTLGEIERGIEQIGTADPVFAEALGSWLEQLIDGDQDRLLQLDEAKRFYGDILGTSVVKVPSSLGMARGWSTNERFARARLPLSCS